MTELPVLPLPIPHFGSDGQCTGFPNGIGDLNWQACCIMHDLGATDGQFLDCMFNSVPHWAWPIVAFAVAVMVTLRPAYNWIQRKGWVK